MKPVNTQIFFLILLVLAVGSCSGEVEQFDTMADRIDALIEEDRYEEALEILEGEDASDPEINLLKEKVHLNYGLYNMSTFDEGEMRTRMNEALRQFAEVLKLNPENSVARSQIEQIMGVYATMPDRGPEESALEALRSVGYDY